MYSQPTWAAILFLVIAASLILVTGVRVDWWARP